MSHDARTQILTDGAKALLVINGGGIVALLGVLAKLLPFSTSDEKYYATVILVGIASLTIGLVLAAANYYFRFWTSHYWDEGNEEKHPRFYSLERLSVLLSFTFFIFGVLSIVVRIYLYVT